MSTSGIINTIAGNGTPGFDGDGSDATAAMLYFPAAVAVDAAHNMYIADEFNNRIRKVLSSLTNVPTVTDNNTIKTFPNPVTTQLTIQSTDKPISQIIITNLLGQTMYANQYNTEQAQVDVSGLTAGVYFVKVNSTEVRKFVKE